MELEIYQNGTKSEITKLSSYNGRKESCIFVRGFFDIYGMMNKRTCLNDELECCMIYNPKLSTDFEKIIEKIYTVMKIDFRITCHGKKYEASCKGREAIQFLYNIYHDSDVRCRNPSKYDLYLEWLLGKQSNLIVPQIEILGDNKPKMENVHDHGYKITIYKKIKTIGRKISVFDTRIRVKIPQGYVIRVIGEDSLHDYGYQLLTEYITIPNDSIKLRLMKFDDTINKEISLPFVCCRMILEKNVYYDIKK